MLGTCQIEDWIDSGSFHFQESGRLYVASSLLGVTRLTYGRSYSGPGCS
jgi:hypothetical protein